jgi:hypothetical protein
VFVLVSTPIQRKEGVKMGRKILIGLAILGTVAYTLFVIGNPSVQTAWGNLGGAIVDWAAAHLNALSGEANASAAIAHTAQPVVQQLTS